MSFYRGTDGFVSQGGAIVGSPLVQGATAQGQDTATFDGAAFDGVIRPGDKFTVAGDAQEYEIVTAGVVGASTPNEITVTFTPNVQAVGGWADNAAVTFVSNQVAQVTQWEAAPTRPVLDTTVMGDVATERTLDVPEWSGRATALFDYDDVEQKAIADQLVAGSVPTALAGLFAINPGKQLWGDVLASEGQVTSERGGLVEVAFSFSGTGVLAANWN